MKKGMRIKAAAIMEIESRKVWTGPSHSRVLLKMKDAGVDRLICIRGEWGFVTECGMFVRRKPALRIAEEAGQVVEKNLVAPQHGLFSEDLI